MNLEKEIFDISLQDIIPNRFQPREMFDDEALKELSQSIREHGVIQPIIVRKVGDKYEIIAGERRFRASQLAGKETIPALVRDIDDKEAAKIALLENLQRSNLTPIEEAKTYKTILKLDNITQEELAQNLGKSQSTIANKLRLLTLDEEVQTALLNSQISERHARSLIGLDYSKQNELLHRIINEKLTVRQLDEEIMRMTGKMPENDQTQTAKVPNLSEGRISMDIAQNPVVQTPSFDNAPIKPNQAVPGINPILNNQPVFQPETNTGETIINQTMPQTNNVGTVNIPEVQQINQNVTEANTNIPTPQEPVTIQNDFNTNVGSENISETTPEEPIQTPNQNPTEELHKNNIFDKLRVQSEEKITSEQPAIPQPETSIQTNNLNSEPTKQVEESEQEKMPNIINNSTIIQSKAQNQTPNQNFNNIYDLRFAINNFRQAIQNTEKFGFKVKAEEYDSENKYQIVIEIEKKN